MTSYPDYDLMTSYPGQCLDIFIIITFFRYNIKTQWLCILTLFCFVLFCCFSNLSLLIIILLFFSSLFLFLSHQYSSSLFLFLSHHYSSFFLIIIPLSWTNRWQFNSKCSDILLHSVPYQYFTRLCLHCE